MAPSTTSPDRDVPAAAITSSIAIPVALIMLAIVASLALLIAQVRVTDDTVGATRACGSSFDALVDRSGWELWWARDLDEPDPAIRGALVRTELCPRAINRRLVVVAIVGALAASTAVLTGVRVDTKRRARPVDRAVADDVARLGRATAWTGAFLTTGGVIAIVALTADADSTIYLYVDRLVVALVGLIVLMPAIAVFALGRALVVLGKHLDHPGDGAERHGS